MSVKLPYSPYRDIPEKLEGRQAFEGNSMSAKFHNYGNGDKSYRVYSYDTVIAEVWPDEKITWIVAKNRWGPTKGRHINLCRRHLND